MMASQLGISQSTFGVASVGDVNIGGNLVVGSSLEESFEELDPPRESEVFKGREEDIGKLEALFFKAGKRKVVIHGLPGFGKTELAVRFAKNCKDSTNIDKAFWISAETSENLKRLHKTLKKVYNIFANKRCLFIFDNGVSRSSIRLYEPPNEKNFYLLITSHVADWGNDIYQMSLKSLNEQASLDVFKAILCGRYQEDEENVYIKMIEFVSNAPLGLIVIAGHLRFKMDANKQKKFDSNHFFGEISRMLDTKIHHSQCTYYEKSIYSAMFVVLEKMNKQEFAESEQTRELSIKVMGICAYLNPDFINIKDIKEIVECSEENTVNECLYLTENFSFIEYYGDGSIKIHRLCQRILKLYFDEIKKDYYSVCLHWVLRKEYWHMHEDTILMEADNKKETVLKIYQLNVSENHYRYIEKLLRLLVHYGCYESCKLIFDNISFEKRKQFVDNMKLIHVAVKSNEADVLKLLLEYGDLNVQDSEDKRTPLHWASRKESVDIVRMLLEKGADVHARDNEGKTPLYWAYLEGNIEIVRMLLEKGADVHVRDSEGKIPLHWAYLEGNIDIVRMLLEKGADVHVRDSEGKTPLHWAPQGGNVEIVRLLLEKGADVHVRDSADITPLHMACYVENVDIVRMLLEKGADVHASDSKDRTPLHIASYVGNVNTVRMLLEKGADVHVRDIRGKTPLHIASVKGNIDIVRMLLEKGADVHARDNEDKTPLDRASLWGHTDIINILQQLMH